MSCYGKWQTRSWSSSKCVTSLLLAATSAGLSSIPHSQSTSWCSLLQCFLPMHLECGCPSPIQILPGLCNEWGRCYVAKLTYPLFVLFSSYVNWENGNTHIIALFWMRMKWSNSEMHWTLYGASWVLYWCNFLVPFLLLSSSVVVVVTLVLGLRTLTNMYLILLGIYLFTSQRWVYAVITYRTIRSPCELVLISLLKREVETAKGPWERVMTSLGFRNVQIIYLLKPSNNLGVMQR